MVNVELDKNIDLKTYLPDCYKGIVEAEAEQDSLSIEINKLNAKFEQAMNDQFIQRCSLKAIKYYEDTFNIVHDPSNPEETLEFRRSRVLNRMKNLRPPYTYWYLRMMLDSFFGVGNYNLQIEPNEYIIILESSAENSAWYHEIAVTMTTVVPCNMIYINKPRIDHKLLMNETVLLNLDIKHNYTLDGTWRLGLRPFISESGQVVAKMANVSSITNNLITQNLNFCKNSVTKVKLNDTISITSLEKTQQDSTMTISYALEPSIVSTITNIKLLDSDNNVLTNSNVYIQVEGEVTIKHILKIEEGVNA